MTLNAPTTYSRSKSSDAARAEALWRGLFCDGWRTVMPLACCLSGSGNGPAERLAGAAFCRAARARASGEEKNLNFTARWARACVEAAKTARHGDGSLLGAVRRLPPRQQLAVLGHDVCRLPAAQVATLAGVSEKEFGQLLLAARLALAAAG